MGIYLPNEAWGTILENLFTKDLLTTRLVSAQFNQESLCCLKKREIQITIRSDIELVKYCKFLSNSSSIFHEYLNINFVLHPISSLVLNDMIRKLSPKTVRCTLNVQTQQPFMSPTDFVLMEEKLTTILKHLNNLRSLEVIADSNTVMCKVDIPQVLEIGKLCLNIRSGILNAVEYFLCNSILEASPNLMILILKGDFQSLRFLPPPLMKLKRLSFSSENCFPDDSFILNNLLYNKPVVHVFGENCNLKKFYPLFLTSRPSTRVDYNFSLITVCQIELQLKRMTQCLSEVNETVKVLKIINAIYSTYEKKTIEIPPLKRLHTFIYRSEKFFSGGENQLVIVRIMPEGFPKLKSVTLDVHNKEENPFTEVYPTVKNLKFNYYIDQNWQTTFPNVTSIKANWCNHNYERFLELHPKIQYVKLCLKSSDSESDRDIWNELTGNAEIRPGTVFYIQKVHDEKEKTSNKFYPVLPNVTVLRVENARLVHVAAISFISHYHNFKTFKKLKFYISENIFQTIPDDLIKILKKHHNVTFFSAYGSERMY